MQFDAQGGLDFTEPVQKKVPGTGIENYLLFQPPALRLLIDFTRHLRDVTVPLYRLGARYFNSNSPMNRNQNQSTIVNVSVLSNNNGNNNNNNNGNNNNNNKNENGFEEEEVKGSYQSVSFSMVLRSATPKGSYTQLLDAINAVPNNNNSNYSVSSPHYTPAYTPMRFSHSASNSNKDNSNFNNFSTSNRDFNANNNSNSANTSGKGTLTRRSVSTLLRRDLMGTYSALPLTPTSTHKNQNQNLPTGFTPEPPFLPSPKWLTDEFLLSNLEEDREKEVCFHTLLWALPALLRHLPLDQIILAIGCALTEMRVVVVGEDLSVVSGCVLALVHLLRPLKWAGPVIRSEERRVGKEC